MDRPDIPDFFTSSNRNDFDPDKFFAKYKWLLITVLVLVLILPNLVILVGAGQRAVIFNRITGIEKRVLDEGVQFIIPGLQKAAIYDVREISYIFSDKPGRSRRGALIVGGSIHTLTADGQSITLEATTRARPNFGELWWLHQNIGNTELNSYVEKIITPMVRSVVREVVSGYTVSRIYSEDRHKISEKIAEELSEKFQGYKIVLTEFLLDEVVFSPAYQEAIELKQQARIELDTKDNIIIEEENKRDAMITQAEGEAQAISLKVNALARNPAYIKFRRAQVFGKRTRLIIDDKI